MLITAFEATKSDANLIAWLEQEISKADDRNFELSNENKVFRRRVRILAMMVVGLCLPWFALIVYMSIGLVRLYYAV